MPAIGVYDEDRRAGHSASCAGPATSAFLWTRCATCLRCGRDNERESADVKRLALAHVAALDAKAREIAEMSSALRRLAEHCEGNRRPDCPIIDDLGRRGLWESR